MKRSTRVSLFLMGSAMVTSCSDHSKVVDVFSDMSECIASGTYTRDQCEVALEQAKEKYKASAPKYKSKEDCEVDFGLSRCETTSDFATNSTSSDLGSFWMPMMMGYLVSHALGNLKSNNSAGQPLYYSNIQPSNRPWGRSSGGWSNNHVGSWTINNLDIARKKGLTLVDKEMLRSTLPTANTILRGGFGARASYFGINSSG